MENLGKPLTPIFIDKLGPAYSNDENYSFLSEVSE